MKFLEMLLMPERIQTNHTFQRRSHQRSLLQKKLVSKVNKRFHQFQMIQKIPLRMDLPCLKFIKKKNHLLHQQKLHLLLQPPQLKLHQQLQPLLLMLLLQLATLHQAMQPLEMLQLEILQDQTHQQ
jgi:hypothetical protein